MPAEVLTFTGIDKPQRGWGVSTNGTTPDTYAVMFVPQVAAIPNAGTSTLVFGGGLGATITLTNCYIDKVQHFGGSGGWYSVAYIWDRRWIWQRRVISGRYNKRLPDGTIDTSTEKTWRQLATLLLTAIGEGATVVTALPNTRGPEVAWDNAYASDELAALLAAAGCVIGIPNNVTTIYALGGGSGAPSNTDIQSIQQDFDPPEVPDELILACNDTIVQSKLRLVAVGKDTDGSVQLLADLSYAPAGGWGSVSDWTQFLEIEDADANALARETVGKWFRVDAQADGNQEIDGFSETPTDATELFPLSRELLESYDDIDGAKRAGKAWIEGTFEVAESPDNENVNSPDFTKLELPFRLETDHGLVKFATPVRMRDEDTQQWTAAELYLVCTYSVLNPTTNHYFREEFTRTLGGTGTVVVRAEQLYRTIEEEYSGAAVTATNDNLTALTTEADDLLDAWETRFTAQTSFVITYRHIQGIFANGVISQVAYKMCSGPRHTPWQSVAYVATEGAVQALRQAERARRRIARQVADYEIKRNRVRNQRDRRHWRA